MLIISLHFVFFESQEYCHEFIKICKNKLPMLYKLKNLIYELFENKWERSGSVVECLTGDRRAAGTSLTVVTVLCP